MRIKLLLFIGFVLILLSAVAGIAYTMAIDRFAYVINRDTNTALISQQTSASTNVLHQNKAIEDQITQTGDAIKSKQGQLDTVNKTLSDKLKALDDTNKKIKAQQDQLASDSAELTKLRNRPADQPPLFN